MDSTVSVHPLTTNPDEAWKKISLTVNHLKLNPILPFYPVPRNYLRFVCMSDTHLTNIQFPIPYGDVYLHAGDFTQKGTLMEVAHFNAWLGALPHRWKVVICGNHEIDFDPNCNAYYRYSPEPKLNPRLFLTNCIYLQDSWVDILGVKIYGAPWQPYHKRWAFSIKRGLPCLSKWNLIPDNTDIVLTHSPPLGYGDVTSNGNHAGCVELLSTIQRRVKPKYHVFGHVHEGYGMITDGKTIYINAATCNSFGKPTNLPIVFDYPIPPGYFKPY